MTLPADPPSNAKRKTSPSVAPDVSAAAGKKHHVCPVCERGFSTTGHLARHARVHTGERNHKCPFPGCETKCSRQDNLQQHYRIHLSPGSRRKSGRSVLRSKSTPAPCPRGASASSSVSACSPSGSAYSVSDTHNSPPRDPREDEPPLSPPPLEDSRLYFFGKHGIVHDVPSPNTPPPLVEAHVPPYAPRSDPYVPSQAQSYQTPDSPPALVDARPLYPPVPSQPQTQAYQQPPSVRGVPLPAIDTAMGGASARSSPGGDGYWQYAGTQSHAQAQHSPASYYPSPSAPNTQEAR
ncbi:hypothetical protein C8R44DRAFT_195666 [Mycena epipterygia]|nr:hypothetical protein C8R44DRAFT_195666 [Mycena epipterygia]